MSESRHKPVVGLIGAIGAGKSAAAAAFARHGGFIVDADRVGHEVLELPAVKAKLRDRWRDGILHADGRINRRAVAEIVFASEAERKALEAIVYPAIESRCRELIAAADAKFVVLDAAVMLEAGWNGIVDKLVFIDAPLAMRQNRVAARGWTAADLTAREAAQWPAEKKLALADAAIENAGTLDELQASIDSLLKTWGWL